MEFSGEETDWREAKRKEVLDLARLELGAGSPEKYWSIVGRPDMLGKAWCGSFCLAMLKSAGLAQGIEWEFDPKHGHYGFCFRLQSIALKDAQPGDICYFAGKQHHALFVRLEDTEHGPTLVSLDANQRAPERVQEKRRRAESVALVFSIEAFLRQALDTEPAPPPESHA